MLLEWTKNLRQQHFSIPNEPTTLCGRPMLGTNYARVYDQEDKTPCPKSAHEAQLYRLDESA